MAEIYFDPVDHSYTDEFGISYTPVTTICKKTPRAVDFQTLPNQEAIKKSALRGSMIHDEIERFVKYGEDGITKVLEWFKRVLYPMFTDWQSEVLVYSSSGAIPYAGKVDLIAKNKKRWIIIDLKNGNHTTVDYQTSLYKRAWCEMNNIDPSLVDCACVDAKNEDAIDFFRVRTIPEEWLKDLLKSCAEDLPYIEPLPQLKGVDSVQLVELAKLEDYITSIEKEKEILEAKRTEYKDAIYKAMKDALVDTFEFGSLKITRVKESSSTSSDSKRFKQDNPKLYEEYVTETRKSGYLKITVRDVTKKGNK